MNIPMIMSEWSGGDETPAKFIERRVNHAGSIEFDRLERVFRLRFDRDLNAVVDERFDIVDLEGKIFLYRNGDVSPFIPH